MPGPLPPLSHDAKRAVVLLSGGLDSATVLAMANAEGYATHCLSFAYGQRQAIELDNAAEVARALGAVEQRVIHVDLAAFGGSALTASLAVPKDRATDAMQHGVPITYVPARNTIFLSLALAYAEVLGAFDLFIGANAVDFSGYPDCRPEFIAAFEQLANVATGAAQSGRGHFRVHAPLLRMSKAEIIQAGVALGVDYGITHSCYDPEGQLACGHCDACILRREGFRAARVADPTRYVQKEGAA